MVVRIIDCCRWYQSDPYLGITWWQSTDWRSENWSALARLPIKLISTCSFRMASIAGLLSRVEGCSLDPVDSESLVFVASYGSLARRIIQTAWRSCGFLNSVGSPWSITKCIPFWGYYIIHRSYNNKSSFLAQPFLWRPLMGLLVLTYVHHD